MSWFEYYEKEPKYGTVSEALAEMGADALKVLHVKLFQEKVRRKADAVTRFAQYLSETSNLMKLWREKLDGLQQKAVAEAAHDPKGKFDALKFVAKYGQAPSWGPKSDQYDFSSITEPSLLQLFIYKQQVMPDDLRARLQPHLPAPPPMQVKSTPELPADLPLTLREFDWRQRKETVTTVRRPLSVRETERAAAHNLAAVLRLVESGAIAVSEKTLQPSAAAQQTIAGVLRDGDFYETAPAAGTKDAAADAPGPIQSFAWPALLQAAKLAEIAHKKLAFTPAGRKATGQPAAETLRLIWQNWRKTRLFDELRRVDIIKGQTGKGQKGLTGVANRRAAIVKALAQCPVGAWIQVDDFLRFLIAADCNFSISREPWELYVGSSYYGNLQENGNWEIMEGRFALTLLFEYAATLGLLDVAYTDPHYARRDFRNVWGTDDHTFFSRYDGLHFFRLTPLGAYCLGLAKDYTPPQISVKGRLTVLPGLRIVAHGPLSPDETLLLDLYAERVDDLTWHLSVPKTMTALAQGGNPDELQQFLSAREEQELPPTVERFLLDAKQRARALKDRGTARLIECADAATAELIATHASLKKYCYRAGDKALVVPADTEKQFRQALLVLGYCLP